jgi:hypothetical protein
VLEVLYPAQVQNYEAIPPLPHTFYGVMINLLSSGIALSFLHSFLMPKLGTRKCGVRVMLRPLYLSIPLQRCSQYQTRIKSNSSLSRLKEMLNRGQWEQEQRISPSVTLGSRNWNSRGRKRFVLFLPTLPILNTAGPVTSHVTTTLGEPNHFGVEMKNVGEPPCFARYVLVFLISLFRGGSHSKSN